MRNLPAAAACDQGATWRAPIVIRARVNTSLIAGLGGGVRYIGETFGDIANTADGAGRTTIASIRRRW
jgi:hypothetical protein